MTLLARFACCVVGGARVPTFRDDPSGWGVGPVTDGVPTIRRARARRERRRSSLRSVSVPGSAAPKITGSRVVAIGESRSVMTSAATGLSQNTQSAQFVPDHGGVLYAHETMTAPEDEDLLSYVQCVGLDSDLDPGGCVPSAHVESDPRCVSAIPRGFDRDMHLPVISLVPSVPSLTALQVSLTC